MTSVHILQTSVWYAASLMFAFYLADFLISPAIKGRMQDALTNWWVYVEESKLGSGAHNSAVRFLTAISNMSFITGWFGLAVALIFGSVVALVVSGIESHSFLGHPLKPGQSGAHPRFLMFPLLLGALLFVAQKYVARGCLRILTRHGSAAGFPAALLMGSLLLAFASLSIALSVFGANWYEFHVRPLGDANVYHARVLTLGPPLGGFEIDEFVTVCTAAFAAVAYLPVPALFWLRILIFSISKAFHSVLRPATSYLIERIAADQRSPIYLAALVISGLITILGLIFPELKLPPGI